MSTATLWRVNTHELREGDVVHVHGMRLRLTERREYPPVPNNPDAGAVVAFTGLVLNLDEVRTERAVPIAWLYDSRESKGLPVWTVQGNGLATWCREEAS